MPFFSKNERSRFLRDLEKFSTLDESRSDPIFEKSQKIEKPQGGSAGLMSRSTDYVLRLHEGSESVGGARGEKEGGENGSGSRKGSPTATFERRNGAPKNVCELREVLGENLRQRYYATVRISSVPEVQTGSYGRPKSVRKKSFSSRKTGKKGAASKGARRNVRLGETFRSVPISEKSYG